MTTHELPSVAGSGEWMGGADLSAPNSGAGAGQRLRRGARVWMVVVIAALAALSVLAWQGLRPPSAEMREQVHVIPKGTWARRIAGENLDVLPQTIRLTMGVQDILVLINHDDVPQLFGPVLMMPGQSFRLPFNLASEYQFTCTAHVSGYLTVIVAPEPPWWKLFLARMSQRLGLRG
jgi:hypothetical protein